MELYLYPHVSREKWILLRTIFIDRLKNCGDFLLVQFLGTFWLRRLKGAFLCWCHIKLGFIIPKQSYRRRECRSSKVKVVLKYVRPCSWLKVHHTAHWSLFFLHAQLGPPCTERSKTTCIEVGSHMHKKKRDCSVSTKHHSRHLRQGSHDTSIWENVVATFTFFLCISKNSFVQSTHVPMKQIQHIFIGEMCHLWLIYLHHLSKYTCCQSPQNGW